MNKEKKARLEAQGWKVGSAAEFLGITPDEAAYSELKLCAPRAGWDEAFRDMARRGDDALLDGNAPLPTSQEDEEWE